MIDEGSDGAGLAKIHAQLHARIHWAVSIPVRDVDCVSEVGLVHRNSIPFQQLKMQLVDVEVVQLLRAVFNDPVFDVALPYDNVGIGRVRIERCRGFSLDRQKKTVGLFGFFGSCAFSEK